MLLRRMWRTFSPCSRDLHAEKRIANTAASVNLSGYTASGIMSLMNENVKKNQARRSHQEKEAAVDLSPEELRKRYKESSFLTAGQVFGHGNGRLGEEVRDEVIRRNEARKDKEAAVESRKKMKLRELISSAKVIKDKMKSKKIKLTGKDLLVLVRYKRMKGDQPMPKGVAALRTRWNDTKHRASPHCSPNNSDDEEEEDDEEEDDVNDEEGGEMGTTGLVFGHDESEDESDD